MTPYEITQHHRNQAATVVGALLLIALILAVYGALLYRYAEGLQAGRSPTEAWWCATRWMDPSCGEGR